MVGTFHASGDLGWMKIATPVWGFLADRIDRRIAVSEMARETANSWLPGDYEIIPNGVLIPDGADPAAREHRIVFAGPARGAQGAAGAARGLAGDPAPHRRDAAHHRRRPAARSAADDADARARRWDRGARLPRPGELHRRSCSRAKALVAPSLGGESFGMVLTRALACATPVVASDIPGYRDVMTPEACVVVPCRRRRGARRGRRATARRRAEATGDGRSPDESSRRSSIPGMRSRGA